MRLTVEMRSAEKRLKKTPNSRNIWGLLKDFPLKCPPAEIYYVPMENFYTKASA